MPNTTVSKSNLQSAEHLAFEAFENAIADKRLSKNENDSNYAGHYMFMGYSKTGKALFKNIMSREYIL